MKSPRGGLPRVRRAPRAVDNDVDDAVRLATDYGLKPFDWQEDVLETWLGRRRDDRWAASTCGLAVPRQNGKNAVIEVRELYGMAILGERFLHTAHEVKTARKAFLRIASFFENERKYPELAALVKDIRKTNGQEAVLLKNGGGVEFIARSKGSGRGFTVDVLVCDEAQELTDEELAALLPTISAAPLGNPQVLVTGTPPDPEKPTQGEVFRRVREDGEAGRDSRLAWTDYGAADGPLPDVYDDAAVLACNPSAPDLLSMNEIERERSLMSPETFARERMGWWGDPAAALSFQVLPGWQAIATTETPDAAPAALGIAADLDQTLLSLGAVLDCSPRHLGSVLRTSTADNAAFVAEVARIHQERAVPVGIDKKGPASFLIPALEDAGVQLTFLALDDFVQACADARAAVEQGAVTHGNYDDLNAAVDAATWRKVGDRRVFGRKSGDISSLEAVAIALWTDTNAASTATVW